MARAYDVIPHRVLVHVESGREFSIGTAFPPIPGTGIVDYETRDKGWTVYNPLTNQYGIGRKPWATEAEAQAWAKGKVCSAIGIGD